MNNHLKVICLLGISAFLAVGCNGLTIDDGSNSAGGTSGNCLVSSVNSTVKLPLNSNISVPAGTGISSRVAEVFKISGETQPVSKVTLLLDQVAPAGSNLSDPIQVGIYQDELFTPNGQASPTQPAASPYVDMTSGVRAWSTSVSAASISTTGGPQWYDFCFNGASGNGCSGTGGQVTFQQGQVYWIIISGAPSAGTSAYLDWYGSSTAMPYSAGEIYVNGSGFVPVNNPSTNFNFAFKLGC